MTQETTAVANTAENKPLSPEEQAIMDELRKGSGEMDQAGSYTKIPYITINNKMVLEETSSGRNVKARCEPEFIINTQEDGEYKEEPFSKGFNAVILAVRHRVQRKYLTDQQGNCINKLPFYRSLEFKSFRSPVHIRQNKEFLPPMSYQETKNMSPEGKENELWGIAYVLIEGDDVVRKVEVKGASRGALFDYVTAKRGTSISGVVTKFELEIDNDNATPYNKLVLTNTGVIPSDLKNVLDKQKELLAILADQETPNVQASQGEVFSSDNVGVYEDVKQINEQPDQKNEDIEEVNNTSIEDLF